MFALVFLFFSFQNETLTFSFLLIKKKPILSQNDIIFVIYHTCRHGKKNNQLAEEIKAGIMQLCELG